MGLAIAIERIIYLNFATTNTEKLVEDIESALKSGGVDSAKEICRNTPGPVASIFYQGLDRAGEGVESAEKAVVAYGGVQMGQLEKNVSWISLLIYYAPILGFMVNFSGMIKALSYGAPPHGGIAPGIDRIVMVLADKINIREITLFPMNQNAQDLMMKAPSKVDEKLLKELGIKIDLKKN